jgi:hypothetical protein
MITARRCVSALPHTPTPTFGDLLAASRGRLGWTMPDLRRALAALGHDYSQTLIVYWHTGARTPRPRSVLHLAEALGWSASERLAAFDAHATQWEGPVRQVHAVAARLGFPDLTRLDAYDAAAQSDAVAS